MARLFIVSNFPIVARALLDSLTTTERELASSSDRPRRVESTPHRRSAAGLRAGSNSSTTTMAPPMDLGTAAVMISPVAVQHARDRRASPHASPRYTTTSERSSSSPTRPAIGAPRTPRQGPLPSPRPRPRPPFCRPREPCVVLPSRNRRSRTSSSTTSKRAAQEPPPPPPEYEDMC